MKKIVYLVMTMVCIMALIACKNGDMLTLSSSSSMVNTSNSYSEFIDDQAFEYINKIYSDIDFSSDFKQGDHSVYADYKERYLKLLDRRIPFKSEGKKYYIDEYIYGDFALKIKLDLFIL